MERNVLVTGADSGLGLALCSGLLRQGWHVFAGQYRPDWRELASLAENYPQTLHNIPLDVSSMDSVQSAVQTVGTFTKHLDVLINNAGINSPRKDLTIRAPQDYSEMHRLYDVNSLGPLRMAEAFLPMMELGTSKRLCFISSEAGSIGRAERTSWFGYCMSKAALNMAVKILFNDLSAKGYTVRVYHPGSVRSNMDRNGALQPEDAAARAIPILLGRWEQEDRLVMVDYEGNEWPW